MKTIILPGEPVSTNQLYRYTCRGKFPHMYMTEKGTALKTEYWWEAKKQWKGKPLSGSVGVEVRLFFKSKRKHDIDNATKILFDSLIGVVWKDDSQIEEMNIRKDRDNKKPRIEISIYSL